ncbi:MAG TPA: GDP-mannose 4,6-dehydratase [Terriglobia bacterium]|nr:GDP-mannose 4,6-dehydratase [Terriglobia bacterium]
MTSLITGGAGFIGSHLAEALVVRREKVIILDDLSTGSVENIRHLRANPRLHCFFESVMDRRLLAELVDESDIVFHLAAAVGVRRIIESPVRTIETNVTGTEVVLEAAAKKKKLVFVASTSEVYGKNSKAPFAEDDDIVLGPTSKSRWSYATSKALDEFLALAYWKEKRLPVVIARFFNTVGPRQTGRYGMVLPTFVGQALEGVPLTVFGTGKQSRCFGYVGDAVQVMLRLVSQDRAVGEVVNIGNNEEITIEDLAALVRERTGSASPVEFVPYDQAYEPGFEDMARRVPSLEKLLRLTDYRPTTPLPAIIDKVVAHCAAKEQVPRLSSLEPSLEYAS